MSTISAIETRYRGYRFRSRLEARWAVFFDALGLTWDYETEGYDLGELGYYLPDFWVNGLGFVEIKGHDRDTTAIHKLSRLLYAPKSLGTPTAYLLRSFDVNKADIETVWLCGNDLNITAGDDASLRFWVHLGLLLEWEHDPLRENLDKLIIAYRSALSARFEHGEQGGSP